MPFTFSCSDIDSSCPVKFVSDSEVQLLDQIHRHVSDEHPELPKGKATTDLLKQAIKPAPQPKG